jgi:hypothetical protein
MELRDSRWLARFRLHHRAANHCSAGRAFVAGDAAHIHSPAGGQGMNTGLQDAANLAWKLALVLRGHAPEGFLDSYEAERLPVGRRLLRTTDRLFAGTAARGPVSLALAGFLLPRIGRIALGQPRLAVRGFRFISQLEIAYPSSPVVDEARPRFRGGPRAGHRAPDAPVRRDDTKTTLFSLCTGAAHHLLVFGGDSVDALRTLAAEHLGDVRAHHITRSPRIRDAWLDESGEAHRRYGITESGYYLIRPDGYIAFRADELDTEPLAQYLRDIFPPQ